MSMTESQKRYLEHAMQHNLVRHPSLSERVLDMPSCRKCERVALRHGKGVRCPVCGYEGPGGPPIRLIGRDV